MMTMIDLLLPDADATDRLISFIGRDPRWVSG